MPSQPDDSARSDPPSLEGLLASHRDELARLVARRGAGLLRFESADDLVQGVQLRALEAKAHFEYQGEREFLGWIARVARQHLARRGEHWRAMRRSAGRVFRIRSSASMHADAGSGTPEPPNSATSPPSAAFRREQVELATRALATLFPRDRTLVQWISEDLSIDEIAQRLGISHVAAKKARFRALERFRRTFELVVREGSEPPG